MAVPTVTTQGWILSLFIRDDGQRFLLGSGAFEFLEEQQHFAANTFVNDVVEIQGNDGELLAGQVRRASTQEFNGYVGDPTIGKTQVETYRRQFFAFFQKNHFYTVVYVMCNGSAIQRRRGYIVDAPEVKEIIQYQPQYHVALNFEDVNYYTYSEDENGNEIFSNYATLITTADDTGGLVWQSLSGSKQVYKDGTNITITKTIASQPVDYIDLKGDTAQSGTPTAADPQPIETVAGVQDIMVGDGVTDQDVYTVDLGSIELCKIGNSQDYIYEQNSKFFLHKEILKETGYSGTSSTIIGDMVPDSEVFSSCGGTVSGQTITYDDILTSDSDIYYVTLNPTDTEITDAGLISDLQALNSATCYGGVTAFKSGATTGNLPSQMTVYVQVYNGGGIEWDGLGAIWEPGGGSSVTTVTNNSIANVAPTFTVTGLAVNPSLTNLTTNQTLTYVGNVTATQTLVIDVARKTAKLNGTSVIAKVSGEWPTLAPGNNRLTYTTDNTPAPNATIEWQEVVG